MNNQNDNISNNNNQQEHQSGEIQQTTGYITNGKPNGSHVNQQGVNYYGFNAPRVQNTVKKKFIYTTLDRAFALIALAIGFLFIRFVLLGSLSVSVFVFFLASFGVTAVYMLKSDTGLNGKNLIPFIIPVVFSSIFLISDNDLVKMLNLIFVVLCFCYIIFAQFNGVRIGKGFGYSLLNSTLLSPFSSYGDGARASIQAVSTTKKTHKLKWVLLGLLIAIPITSYIAVLLLSSDEMFSTIFNSYFANILGEIPLAVFQLIFGIPVALFFFGALYSGKEKKGSRFLTSNEIEGFSNRVKKVPTSLFYSALTPLLILYLLYFIVQSGYFLSAFNSMLPDGYDYAQYARQGFFELCTVAIINLILIWTLISFSKRVNGEMAKGIKVYSIILCVFTLLLIFTVISKMFMYITFNGLTHLRLYTSWFMVLLAIVFVLIIVKVLCYRVNFPKAVTVVFVIMFGVLCFSNVDGLITKYNVEQYQKGSIEWMGHSGLDELDDSAVPYILQLAGDADTPSDVKDDCVYYLSHRYSRYSGDPKDFNIISYTAHEQLEQNKEQFQYPANEKNEYPYSRYSSYNNRY